ncbi:putative amidohydrolase [Methanosarcina horonobensis HB-1 = JCM 15518]|uniref:Putative amidohydrolase n=1 Tax=Methanosarcina horonobensis HB-1 = JCM 15518 TaxID=1434110 RepID=A0A0E3WUX8_9EURY|nr:M20 family metallopeptidase [Methanosarcina horonobensis]AKB79580.1 putative amidohydrolase [Methanosarcina horonobensis HB-1 = JCM 15518]
MRNDPISEDLEAWIIRLRREFHQYPELSFEEYETQKRILKTLEELGIEARKIADTGVLASIRGTMPGPCIALRTDTDGLQVQEELTERNRDYISRNNGVMHACGHDGHMAMLFGASRLFLENRDFPGEVRLIFQPAEEIPPGGSERVIAEGGLEGVDAVMGMHIFTNHESGSVGFRPGPFMASTNRFEVIFEGKGGHISKPESCIDPVRMATDFISSLYPALEKQLEPDKYVLGIGRIQGGAQFNRTPDSVGILGSYRTFDSETTDVIDLTIKECLERIKEKYVKPGEEFAGLPDYELDILHGYPVLVNDPAFTDAVNLKLQESFPELTIYPEIEKTFAAEDFASYLQVVPGIFISLGTRNQEKGIVEINHSCTFDIDEDILLTGTEIFYTISLDFLKHPEKYLNFQKYNGPQKYPEKA